MNKVNKGELAKYIGNKIRSYRLKNNMKQVDLAKLLDVSNTSISEYERGNVKFDADTLFRLAEIFDVKVSDFFPPTESGTDSLELLKGIRTENVDFDDLQFFREIYENAISMSAEERRKYLESLRFMMEYHERMNR